MDVKINMQVISNLLIITLIWLIVAHSSEAFQNGKNGMLLEYCSGESFSPKCRDNEVIIMQSARYGHIQLGRCVDADLGQFGCATDELSLLDQRCSGRKSCDIVINNNNINRQLPCPLPNAFMRYLEAKYSCLMVMKVDEICNKGANVPVKSRLQHLTSASNLETNCGTETKPWNLEAKPGQQINISITDFNWKDDTLDIISHHCPVRYGYVIDTELNEAIDICGGTTRLKQLHLSKGHYVQVVINSAVLNKNNFIISFQAIGCPTYTTPENTWSKQETEIITVGCNHNTNMWKMRCISNNWIGIAGNCENVAISGDNEMKSDHLNEHDLFLGMPQVVAVTIIGGVLITIMCVVVTILIGVFCIKKSKPVSENYAYYMTPQICDDTLPMTQQSLHDNGTGQTQMLMSVNRNDHRAREDNLNLNNASTLAPHYFVLDTEQPVYDAIYQNN